MFGMQDLSIIPIDRETLIQMQDILSLSAGYHVSMEDELQYFEPNNSSGWLVAESEQNLILGFVRNLNHGLDWSLTELYVNFNIKNRNVIAHNLIAEFKKKTQFQSGYRLRFDVLKIDAELNDVIIAEGLSQKVQLFRHFQMPIGNSTYQEYKNVDTINICEVTECLCHLNPVTEPEVQAWVASDQIRIVMDNFHVVAAAQIFINEDSIEINRIATHPQSQRQGKAYQLIQEIYNEAAHKEKKLIYLKVEDIRKPAIALYLKSGFMEVKNKAQLWHSFWC
jgi:ribosomal protein S18 acetylase RimI-like enzyme